MKSKDLKNIYSGYRVAQFGVVAGQKKIRQETSRALKPNLPNPRCCHLLGIPAVFSLIPDVKVASHPFPMDQLSGSSHKRV